MESGTATWENVSEGHYIRVGPWNSSQQTGSQGGPCRVGEQKTHFRAGDAASDTLPEWTGRPGAPCRVGSVVAAAP